MAKLKIPTAAELLDEIDAFIKRTGITATNFGLRTAGDRMLVPKMRRGRVPGLDLAAKIAAFMQQMGRPWCCPACGEINAEHATVCAKCDEAKPLAA